MAQRRLRVHADAHRDLADGRDWYKQHSLIAAEGFLDEIERAITFILEAPERWPPYRLGARRYVLANYPYSIVYRVTSTSVEIFAIAHAKRRATYWSKRTL